MLLLPHATSIANRRGMGLPGLYSGFFLFGASRTARIATRAGSLLNELAKVLPALKAASACRAKKRKPAAQTAGFLTKRAIERE